MADVRFRADFVCFTPESGRGSSGSRESVVDPEATFVKLVTSRHDGAPSNNIQVARQEMCVLRRSKCALIVRNGHGAEFLIAKSARSRADHGLSWQLRAEFPVGCPFCYRCRQYLNPSGKFGL